jgi:hypothetical protein
MVAPLFTDAEVRARRDVEEASMPNFCTIQKNVETRVDGGFITATWTNVATGVPCRLSAPTPGVEALEAGQIQTLGRWILSLPADTPIEKGHRVIVTGTSAEGVSWTQTLSVVAAFGPKTYEVRRKVMCADTTASGR